MGEVLSINLTARDFVADTQHLTAAEVGAYWLICLQIVIRGQDSDPPSLPDDDKMMANIGRISVRQWQTMKPRLCSGDMAVLTVGHGRITQVRVADEIGEARKRITAASTGGKASGEARRRKADIREKMANGKRTTVERPLNDRSLTVQPLREDESNGSRTSHESQVTSHEVIEENVTLRIASSSLHASLRSEDAASHPLKLISPLLANIAPQMRPPSETTVRAWLVIAPDIWSVAAAAIEKGDYLANAKAASYLTKILSEKRDNGGFPNLDDARNYVLAMTNPDRPLIRRLQGER